MVAFRCVVLLSLLCAVLGCQADAPSPAARALPPVEGGRGLALLVGIDHYQQPLVGTVPTLVGAVHDTERVRTLLRERFGFRDADVRVLTDAAATHEAIVRAFDEHLLRQARPGDRVVFWFSGHGSHTFDASGLESAKADASGGTAADNTLVTHDSRARDLDGAYDLVDDELHALLTALARRTDDVLVVTDCCHAAGAVRGGDAAAPGVRRVTGGSVPFARERLAPFWPADVPWSDDDAATLALPTLVHVAACAEHQEAGELRVAGRVHGTLTWFLCEALERAEPGATWGSLIEVVRARVAGCGTRPDQTVVGIGALDRPVFGGRASPPLPGHRADYDAARRRLCIAAGRVHGIADGAEFDLVALDGTPVGTATATAVAAVDCTAVWRERRGELAAGTALRALPRAGALRLPALRVALPADAPPDLLRDFAFATAVGAAAADYRVAASPRGVALHDPTGRPVRPWPGEPAAQRDALFREYTFRGLWEAVAQPATWPLALDVLAADAPTRELGAARGLPLAAVEPVAGTRGVARIAAVPMSRTDGGSLLTLRATNLSPFDLRIVVLSVAENREVNVVWPPGGATDRVLRAGAAAAFPVLVGPATDWSEPRPMVDRYVAFGTVEPLDLASFTSAAPAWSAVRGGAPPLPSCLRRLLGASPMRGGVEADEYAFGTCDLQLVPSGR
ncbi:MAG: caspase family protein [Planctomycetes bacterium]|nr:caspase family protein [Planctomycetota bacterium]